MPRGGARTPGPGKKLGPRPKSPDGLPRYSQTYSATAKEHEALAAHLSRIRGLSTKAEWEAFGAYLESLREENK